jgi:hypothetical protein
MSCFKAAVDHQVEVEKGDEISIRHPAEKIVVSGNVIGWKWSERAPERVLEQADYLAK